MDPLERGAGMARLEGVLCRHCGEVGMIVVEWREEIVTKKVGDFSLAGQQVKFAAEWTSWPWARCTHCGHESRGQRA